MKHLCVHGVPWCRAISRLAGPGVGSGVSTLSKLASTAHKEGHWLFGCNVEDDRAAEAAEWLNKNGVEAVVADGPCMAEFEEKS